MSDEASAPVGGEVASAAPANTPANDGPMSVREAAEAYATRRERKEPENSSEGAAPAATETELADEANAAPAEQQDPGEAPEAADPAEKPTIEPPRSWTKEAKERWSALPPETQEYLAAREQERDREVRRSQNEAADLRKAADAEREQLAKARQDYEAKLPAIVQALQEVQAGQFADIKTMDDVVRMAAEDPFRKIQWDAHQEKIRAVNWELQQAEQRQAQEKSSKWAEHVQAENSKAVELHPELADPAKKEQLQKAAVELLHDKGFSDQELNDLANGKERVSIFDHRLQSLLLDGVKYREAQKAKPIAVAKPVPQVQRPGVAQPKGAAADANVQALSQRLNSTGSVNDAFALYKAKQKARSA